MGIIKQILSSKKALATIAPPIQRLARAVQPYKLPDEEVEVERFADLDAARTFLESSEL